MIVTYLLTELSDNWCNEVEHCPSFRYIYNSGQFAGLFSEYGNIFEKQIPMYNNDTIWVIFMLWLFPISANIIDRLIYVR